MAEFMENRMAPEAPVSFGIQDAIMRAYEYLLEKDRQLKAPFRVAAGGVGAGLGLAQDYIGNTLASLAGADRPDPDEATNEALKKTAPAAGDLAGAGRSLNETISNAERSISDALSSGRRGVVNAMGWKDLQPSTVSATNIAPQPPTMTDVARPSTGAIPAPARRVAPPRPAVGALAAATPETTPTTPEPVAAQPEGDIYPGGTNSMEQFGGGGVATPVAPTPKEPGLREQFVARMSNMAGRTTPELSPEQKGRALFEAGLAIMAAASKPGATALGAIGQGGMQGTAAAREMERINRELADKTRNESRADLRTEFELAGKDEDRANRKEDKSEARRIRELDVTERAADRQWQRENEATKLELLRQQVEAAGWQLRDGADGKVHAYNVRTDEDRVTPLKAKPDKPERNQQIEFYSWMLRTPGAKDLFLKNDTIDMKDENRRQLEYMRAYLTASKDPMADMSKFPTFEEVSARMGIGTAAPRQAPPAALEYLRKNPNQKEAFRQKYGYLPAGF